MKPAVGWETQTATAAGISRVEQDAIIERTKWTLVAANTGSLAGRQAASSKPKYVARGRQKTHLFRCEENNNKIDVCSGMKTGCLLYLFYSICKCVKSTIKIQEDCGNILI